MIGSEYQWYVDKHTTVQWYQRVQLICNELVVSIPLCSESLDGQSNGSEQQERMKNILCVFTLLCVWVILAVLMSPNEYQHTLLSETLQKVKWVVNWIVIWMNS